MNIEAVRQRLHNTTLWSWARQREEAPFTPWLFYINPTNVCNNRCGMCPRHSVMRAERGLMPLELFTKVVDQLPPSARKVYLMKQGEPFLNPNLERMVEYLRGKRPDIHIALHSNAFFATPERTAKILPLIDSMGISISSIVPETYRLVHGRNNLPRVLENLKAMSDTARSLPREKRPHLMVDYVRQTANQAEDEQGVFKFFAENFPGLASVDFHPLFNWQGDVAEANLDMERKLDYSKFPCCVWPWASMSICHDGKIGYCFEEPRENIFLGDVNENTLEEIYNGPGYRRFRRLFTTCDFEAMGKEGFYCGACSYLWDMHSQAPKNLATGYFSDRAAAGKSPENFRDLLFMDAGELAEAAVSGYERGEVHMARGVAQMLASVGKDAEARQAAEWLSEECEAVMERYEQVLTWQEHRNQAIKKGNLIESRYYHLEGE